MRTGAMTLSQLIDLIKDGRVTDAYYVYADEDLDSLRSPDTQVYVDKAPPSMLKTTRSCRTPSRARDGGLSARSN
jgi:hypothetical protein